jgi:hypothetical protein
MCKWNKHSKRSETLNGTELRLGPRVMDYYYLYKERGFSNMDVLLSILH